MKDGWSRRVDATEMAHGQHALGMLKMKEHQ
jgi:hypothetical protein